jgi:hypothetical protein
VRRQVEALRLTELRKAEARARLAAREAEERGKREARAALKKQRCVRDACSATAATAAEAKAKVAAGVAEQCLAGGTGTAGGASSTPPLAKTVGGAERVAQAEVATVVEAMVAEVTADLAARMVVGYEKGCVTMAAGAQVAEAERKVAAATAEVAALAAALKEAKERADVAEAVMREAEADRAKMEVEWKTVVQTLARHKSVAGQKMVRVAVVEAEDEFVDAWTQTNGVKAEEAGCQTAVFSLRPVEVVQAGCQTATAVMAEAQEGGGQTKIGAGPESTTTLQHQRLNPIQAEAVERAERAATRVMQLQAAVEAVAARYTSGAVTAQETAPTAAEVTPVVACAGSAGKAYAQRPATGSGGSGGKQRRKAQLRRQAASAGVDVREWASSREWHKLQLAGRLGGEEGLARLDQRLDWLHEDWLARQQPWHEVEVEGSRFGVLDRVD